MFRGCALPTRDNGSGREARTPTGVPAAVSAGRTVSVFDAQGLWLAGYVDLERAHANAHEWAERDHDVIFVVDPVAGYSWQVTATSCFRFRWGAGAREQRCRRVLFDTRSGAAG